MNAGRFFCSILLLSLTITITPVAAEEINYNLYLNLGFININAGKAQLIEKEIIYDGKKAVYTRLSMSTGRNTDKIFILRDTIESYNTAAGEGIRYRKIVNEGSKSNVETAVFSKDRGRYIVNLQTVDALTGKVSEESTEWRPEPIFDMLSMLRFARSIKTDNKEVGHTEILPMVNGSMVVEQHLVYEGTKRVKADDKNRYDCMVISVRDRKYGRERETLKAYVTQDMTHKPIQLDIIIGIASIRALLAE